MRDGPACRQRGLSHAVERVRDIVRLLRPRQWVKNLVVFAGVIFADRLGDSGALGRAALAAVVFTLVSAGLYALNDAFDAPKDRAHPRKRERPVASGRVSTTLAIGLGIALVAAGLAVAAALGPKAFAVVGAFAALQSAYVLVLKHVVVVDILAISAGFVLRAAGGAVAVDVPISQWLLVCAGLLALLLAAGKRRHELMLGGKDADTYRPVLAAYSKRSLDALMVSLSTAAIVSYTAYAYFADAPGTSGVLQGRWMLLSVPFVVFGIARYQYLVLHRDGGGTPEEILLADVPTLVNVIAWLVTVFVVRYVVY